MSLIHCPYCQSTNIKQGESKQSDQNYFEQLRNQISTVQMASLGRKIAKKVGLSPKTGAVIGVVVGGILITVSQFYYEKYYSQIQRYRCLTCDQYFIFSQVDH